MFCFVEVVRFLGNKMIVFTIFYICHYPIFYNLTNFYMGYIKNMCFVQFLYFPRNKTCVFGQIKVL
jgi:hypothetical protein